MKIVKTNWCRQLNEKNMEALLQIKVEGPTLQELMKTLCNKAVESWWEAKQQQVQQGYKKLMLKGKTEKTNGLQFPMSLLTTFWNHVNPKMKIKTLNFD